MPQQQEITLPKDKFYQYKTGIYILEPDNCAINEFLDKPIYRYINFEILYYLLNDKLIVWRKDGLKDKHEKGELYNPFADAFSCYGFKATEKEKGRWGYLKELRRSTAKWLTLCFSLDADDDYFFWKCYTSGFMGSRFKTTIKRFIDSIQLGVN